MKRGMWRDSDELSELEEALQKIPLFAVQVHEFYTASENESSRGTGELLRMCNEALQQFGVSGLSTDASIRPRMHLRAA